MPSTRPPHDPFTDAPLRPTTSNHALRNQSSQHSLHSNSSAASGRARSSAAAATSAGTGGNQLFAPSLSRRPTGSNRATSRVGEEVLVDFDAEGERAMAGTAVQRLRPQQQQQLRRSSPDTKQNRFARGGGTGGAEEEEQEFVNRQPDGSYLLGTTGGFGDAVALPMMTIVRSEEEVDQAEMDAHYHAISRQFFATGAAFGGRGGKKHEEELEALRLPMMMRLREQVLEKLDNERWQYEAVDWPPPGLL